MKWEYRQIGVWEDWDKYGNEGWELVTLWITHGSQVMGFFKRPQTEDVGEQEYEESQKRARKYKP